MSAVAAPPVASAAEPARERGLFGILNEQRRLIYLAVALLSAACPR